MNTKEIPNPVFIPTASYRLQLHKSFTFQHAAHLVGYLNKLGISHYYTSPWLKARPDSKHGYDIVDHNEINPQIGSVEDLQFMVDELHRNNMGLIADIVPNHMAVMGADNGWWLDVLENGPASTYAQYFDIDWRPFKRELFYKIALPILGDHYGLVLERGELQLKFDDQAGSFAVNYYQHRFPIDPKTYAIILQPRDTELAELVNEETLREYQSLANSFEKLPSRTLFDPHAVEERARDKEIFKQRLAVLVQTFPALKVFIARQVAAINVIPQRVEEARLHDLLEQQSYRLAYWRVAGDEINYRRFFDINDLAGLRMEDPQVFEDTHRLILKQVQSGNISGLRLDHADGLYDPAGYYQRLNRHLAEVLNTVVNPDNPPLYVVAEKIVANYEYLSIRWPLHGTTGYEFANMVNGLFVDPASEKSLTQTYTRFIGHKLDFDDIIYHAKDYVMRTALASELNVLATHLNRISEIHPRTRDYTLNALRDALREVVACFPVYRTYINTPEVRKEDRQYIDWAVAQAQHRSRADDKSVFEFVRRVISVDPDLEVELQDLVSFVSKFQQYTAPVMAKGYEDTALYEYHRLVSLNEVGGDPRRHGNSIKSFHHFNLERVKHWPHAMLSLSTHDSKRSADVRARINVLSEIPELWQQAAFKWSRMNRRLKHRFDTHFAPSRNDEYLFYQTLVGTWPLIELSDAQLNTYRHRIGDYMIKAVREAKDASSWTNPDDTYERVLREFVERALDPHGPFFKDCDRWIKNIAHGGLYNALSQTLVQLTSPGMPDLFQGEELWRFALVDPDNRRAVDFDKRDTELSGMLKTLQNVRTERTAYLNDLWMHMPDGRIKLFLIHQTLVLRHQHKQLFSDGEYIKLECQGEHADRIITFARQYEQDVVIVVAPRFTFPLLEEETKRLSPEHWRNTCLVLPEAMPTLWLEWFSGAQIEVQREVQSQSNANGLFLSEILAHFPCALLRASELI